MPIPPPSPGTPVQAPPATAAGRRATVPLRAPSRRTAHSDLSAPETWETWYRTGRDAWDRGVVSPPLARLAAEGAVRPPGRLVVLGCGRGHEALHFARLGFQVTAVDFAATACRDARARAAAAGVSLRVLQRDLFTLPHRHAGRFDLVLEHACFCALDPSRRSEYAAVVEALLRPNGFFFGLFGAPRPAGNPPFAIDAAEVRDRFGAGFDLLRLEIPPDSFLPRRGQELLFVFRKAAHPRRRRPNPARPSARGEERARAPMGKVRPR